MLRALGAVQLDTISVLARSHELVAYARLGPVGRAAVESAYWAQPARAFEYWAHAACLLPLELWPLFAFRRRRFRALDGAKYAALEPMKRELTRRLEGSGPMTSTDFGGARRGGPWWDWSEAKVAVELLLREGAVVCCQRRGWRRVYDLAERVVPRELLEAEFSDDE